MSKKEAEKIRYKSDTNNYFLPANFVLKTQGTTRARLVLDPSGSLNQALAKAPNLEQNIAQVMRRIQATPVLWSCDIAEAFFRIQTAPDSPTGLFLMDYNKETEELGPGPNSSLVIIRTLVTIMGLLQSLSYLGICREDLAKDITEDELKYFLKYFSYLDDLQGGIRAHEIIALQAEVNLASIQQTSVCENPDCCSPPLPPAASDGKFKERALGVATSEDEKRSTRHLYQGHFGKGILHKLCFRTATLKYALRKASMPSKGITTSLEAHFDNVFVNACVVKYTEMIATGQRPGLRDIACL